MTDKEMNGFTVFVLLYGDHFDLAQRCLGSVFRSLDPELVPAVRVGLNACCEPTRDYVRRCLEHLPPEVDVAMYDASPHNRLKYPMMRKMFYDPLRPIITPFTMWFDDDSYLAPEYPGWWSDVHRAMQQADMIGQLWRKKPMGRQLQGVRQQPWYAGREFPPGYQFTFCTGGWWTIRTRILHQWNYPWPDLEHNGGDTMLGELMQQQKYRMRRFDEGLAINADANGRHSKATRRGESQQPLWYNWQPEDRHRISTAHNFELSGIDPRQALNVPQAVLAASPAEPTRASMPPRIIRLPGINR